MSNVAKHIIAKCGGAQAIASMLAIDVSTVHKWKYPADKGGTGGLIPTNRQQELLERARERGIRLRPSDFFEPVGKPAESSEQGAAA